MKVSERATSSFAAQRHGRCAAPVAADLSSNSRMDSSPSIDQRLTDLEVKASFTEDLVDQLNDVIVRQQRQIDWLAREVAQLRQQIPEGPPAALRNLRDELPPHY